MSQRDILDLIKKTGGITAKELAERIDGSYRAITNNLVNMRNFGLIEVIEREGCRRGRVSYIYVAKKELY